MKKELKVLSERTPASIVFNDFSYKAGAFSCRGLDVAGSHTLIFDARPPKAGIV